MATFLVRNQIPGTFLCAPDDQRPLTAAPESFIRPAPDSRMRKSGGAAAYTLVHANVQEGLGVCEISARFHFGTSREARGKGKLASDGRITCSDPHVRTSRSTSASSAAIRHAYAALAARSAVSSTRGGWKETRRQFSAPRMLLRCHLVRQRRWPARSIVATCRVTLAHHRTLFHDSVRLGRRSTQSSSFSFCASFSLIL